MYLSTKDKELLDQFEKALPHINDQKVINDVKKEIETIKSREKLLKDCSYEECEDLKTQLFDKFSKLTRASNSPIIGQLRLFLKAVDERIAVLYLLAQQAEQEIKKKNKKSDTWVVDQLEKQNEKRKRSPPNESDRSSWSLNLDGID